MDGPIRFIPFVRPMVWGGRRLETLGKRLPADTACGESWDVTDHALHRSVVANGPLEGRTLRDLMESDAAGLLGPAAGGRSTFPWLVKFLDARDWLSVQVHPDDERVRRLWPGEGGKTEAWFVLDVAPGAKIYAGLLPGVDERRLRAALAAGAVADCLHAFEARPGDCVFLPAGTVHAVGGGVLMAEVQQTSDATFRLFDWNRTDAQGRGRTLHLEESLASIDWSQGPVRPIPARGFAEPVPPGQPLTRQELVRCPYFTLEYLQAGAPFTCGGAGRLQALIVVGGAGRLAAERRSEPVRAGQAWLLPAAMPPTECRPEGGLKALLCSLVPSP